MQPLLLCLTFSCLSLIYQHLQWGAFGLCWLLQEIEAVFQPLTAFYFYKWHQLFLIQPWNFGKATKLTGNSKKTFLLHIFTYPILLWAWLEIRISTIPLFSLEIDSNIVAKASGDILKFQNYKLSKVASFVWGKKPNPPKRLSTHHKTLNIIFSASKQNIKNLVGNFGAIHVWIMYAKFQLSSFNGVGGGGDRWKDVHTSSILEQILIQNF